jgi:hypothetical protein
MNKNRLYNIIFPIWLLAVFPPLILIILPVNFIIDSLILLIGLKILKIYDIKAIYKKVILKIWIIGFVADIIGTLILLMSQFLGTNPFIYENFTTPLSTNPFNNPYALIFCIFAIIVSMVLIYFLNKKISFINTGISDRHKTILSLILAITTAPYLFLFPTELIVKNDYQTYINKLEQYKETYVSDKNTVSEILDNLDSKNHMIDFSISSNLKPFSITINYTDSIDNTLYKTMEEDAAILFNLIKDVELVSYYMNDQTYNFYYEDINKIYDDSIKNKPLSEIKLRYKTGLFNDPYVTYLGNIDGIYELFDESTFCSGEVEVVAEDDNYYYSLSCTQIDYLYLVDKSDNKYYIRSAIQDNVVSIQQLLKTNLKIYKEKK